MDPVVGVSVRYFQPKSRYFWRFEVTYILEAFQGVGDESLTILSLSQNTELKTSCKSPAPHPEVRSPAISKEVNVTWLLQMLAEDGPIFKIDREARGCSTPRRNPDVDKAFAHFTMFAGWAQSVCDYLSHLRQLDPKDQQLVPLSPESVFLPTMPVMVSGSDQPEQPEQLQSAPSTLALLRSSDHKGLALTVSDGNRLLNEEQRTLQERRAELAECFPVDGLYTRQEAFLHLTLLHSVQNSEGWSFLVSYVERMLRKQLVAAIGKEVSPALFSAYMRFHYRKLLQEEFQPTQFCFAVRRSEQHSPEGTVAIEEQTVGLDENNIKLPIITFAKCAAAAPERPMVFPLNASTKVSFCGDVHLHGWLSHRFSGQSGAELSLTARARQFSSMLLLVGRITSATSFEPSHAMIVQNKDDLTIPLELSMIPTPKEFRDAISSLSPEMQSFAKSFRAMQLESTLFGVLVVQIKPQLERLLNLPSDSLTKEIKLTQDLMELLMTYQIPSDLLSCDDLQTSSCDTVKQHVQGMMDMIKKEKDAELEAARQAAKHDAYRGMIGSRGSSPRSRQMSLCESDMSLALECEEECEGCADDDDDECEESRELKADVEKDKAPMAKEAKEAPAPARPTPNAKKPRLETEEAPEVGPSIRDYTKVPKEIDVNFEKLAAGSAVRPTIINVGNCWQKQSKKSLLAPATSSSLFPEQQKQQKDAAFDLLDAITKSGALPLTHATLHIVIASTHCFDKTVTDTVIQDNTNPIERVEGSTLIMASAVHQQPVKSIVNQASVGRIAAAAPQLMEALCT